MRARGFSIVELVVVLGILGILMSISTMYFSQMMQKSGIEAQMKTMASDLQLLRSQSFFEKRGRSVVLTSGGYKIYASNDTSVSPLEQKTLSYPIVWGGGAQIDFDDRGLLSDKMSICVDLADNPAAVDSMVLFTTRTQLGKRTPSATCASGNIQLK